MKILHGKLSPFVRKVMVFAIEKGLSERLAIEPTAVGQGKINSDLLQLNPTGKIPTLLTDDGEAVFDSLPICDYLDSLSPSPRAIPQEPAQRTQALKNNAAADGLIVAGVLAMLERGKPQQRQWPEFEAAQWAKVEHCIAYASNFVKQSERCEDIDIGTVGLICAMGWVDARAPHLAWRHAHPELSAWFDHMHSRESIASTRPAAA